MSTVILPHQVSSQSYHQASVYLDACFILAFLDKSDTRRLQVAHTIDLWANAGGVTLGVSPLTYSEVIRNLIQTHILRAVQVYQDKQAYLDRGAHTVRGLPQDEQRALVDYHSAKTLYQVAKSNRHVYFNKDSEFLVNVNELVKSVKKRNNQQCLEVFYSLAVEIYNQLMMSLHNDFGFTTRVVPVTSAEYLLAQGHVSLLLLESADALHLATARMSQFDYIATLDGDFVRANYSKQSSTAITKILSVA
ncbi:hypothetical protein [Alicyclobacillus fodiniaquatilis]|uniref:PIN domain-containing protein n=1 Tax=Alicyclobacillus fodiniaquatilis TaxID=1661150 RepID=A0ABW4JNM4_9BACL